MANVATRIFTRGDLECLTDIIGEDPEARSFAHGSDHQDQFRRDLFSLVNQAMDGAEIWVSHKGRRFKLTPEKKPGSKLSRLTKCDYLVDEDLPDDGSLLKEMTMAWEKDWDEM